MEPWSGFHSVDTKVRGSMAVKQVLPLCRASMLFNSNGLSGLFSNSELDELGRVVEAFRAIGAVESASIILQIAAYKSSDGGYVDRLPGVSESFGDAEERLGRLWEQDRDRRDRLMIDYMLKHRQQFSIPSSARQ